MPTPRARDVWSWLPAFQAVAESEHLPTAAARLHVVPSALSRAIRLLEDALGEPLFSRIGRRLVLNERGRALRLAVNGATERVERALDAAPGAFSGPLRVGTLGVLTNHVVLPALLDLAGEHPELRPEMRTVRPIEANLRVITGELDLAFQYEALPAEGVALRRLGRLSNAVYCGRGHPLFAARGRALTRERVLAHPFSVPAIGDRQLPMDSWPLEVPRRVAFRIDLLQSNIEVSRSGRYLTVLPDVAALPFVRTGELRRVLDGVVPDVEVHAVVRGADASGGMADALIRRVELRLSGIAREVAALRARSSRRRSRSSPRRSRG